jgi:hypothetical protein
MDAARYSHLAGQSRSPRLKKLAQLEQLNLLWRRWRIIRTGLDIQPYVASAANHIATANGPNCAAMAVHSRQQCFTGLTKHYMSTALIINVYLVLLIARGFGRFQSVCRAHRHHGALSGAKLAWPWRGAEEIASIRSLEITVNPKQKRTLWRVAFRQKSGEVVAVQSSNSSVSYP